jgi:hypothetical protein
MRSSSQTRAAKTLRQQIAHDVRFANIAIDGQQASQLVSVLDATAARNSSR